MNKLQTLKVKLEALEEKKAAAGDIILAADELIGKTKQELAALEAESARPREYVVYVDPKTGNITQHKLSAMLGSEEITVREVKPLVITREDVENIFDPNHLVTGETPLSRMVAFLKQKGIDAIPEGGK